MSERVNIREKSIKGVTFTQMTALNETKECEERCQWSELPSIPLENIYSFLSRNDRINMSLVCRNWSEGYGSPSVWKTFRFKLMPCHMSMEACPELKFARKYSKLFNRVEIRYVLTLKKTLVYTWCKHFVVLLKILSSNSQLQSVKIHGLLWCFAHIDKPTRGVLNRSITAFIRSQPYLKRVELSHCFFEFEKYLNLLKQLPENSKNTLTHLEIRGLNFCDPDDKVKELDLSESMFTFPAFPCLTTIGMDYSWIFEKMFARQTVSTRNIKKCQFRVLSKIILKCDSDSINTEYFQSLKSTDWQFLSKQHPGFEVQLNIRTESPKRRDLEFFIAPSMPVKRLKYKYDNYSLEPHNSSYIEIKDLFDRLLVCKINDQLESLCLTWLRPITNLASNFISFLQACKKLKYLELYLVHPTSGINLLMNSWLENRPDSLQRVNLNVLDEVNEDKYTIFMNLVNEYKARLEVVGINLVANFENYFLREHIHS